MSELLSRIDGLDGEARGCCDLPCAADMADVPTYASRFTGGNGLITLNPKRPAKGGATCYAPPRYVNRKNAGGAAFRQSDAGKQSEEGPGALFGPARKGETARQGAKNSQVRTQGAEVQTGGRRRRRILVSTF
mgnify:CR=1 FL=1